MKSSFLRTAAKTAIQKKGRYRKLRDRKCVFLAVDDQETFIASKSLIFGLMDGPMGPFIAGLKFNDALHMRIGGSYLVRRVCELWPELKVFLDLKMIEVSSTVINTLKRYYEDDRKLLVTISVHSDAGVFLEIQKTFPPFDIGEKFSSGIEIAVMGVPTDISRADAAEMYGMYPEDVMRNWLEIKEEQFKRLAEKAFEESKGMHLGQYAISSFDMLEMFRVAFPWIKPITPGIRDSWMIGNRGGQKRITGTVDALKAGAFYVVLGNQLFMGNPADGISAEESQHRTAEELTKYFDGLKAV